MCTHCYLAYKRFKQKNNLKLKPKQLVSSIMNFIFKPGAYKPTIGFLEIYQAFVLG